MGRTKAPEGHFVLLYFAAASGYAKKSSENFQAPTNPKALFDLLEEKYPGMKAKILSSSALTVNLEYVDLDVEQDDLIKEGDEVAIIPPVSAG
ncbi:MAG: hypothetical protein M1831_006196 [Alyxoria varia]|nr:MAG: hypothetical protein M1831_006196 [Alyxoria varia]